MYTNDIMLLLIVFLCAGLIFISIKLARLKQSKLDLQHDYEIYKSNFNEQKFLMQKELYQEKISFLQDSQQQLTNVFESAGAKALERNNRSFIALATETFNKFHQQSFSELKTRELSINHLLSPMKNSLSEVDKKLYDLEKNRELAYQGLKSQVTNLIQSQKELQKETSHLANALRTPHIRGRWGEIQLRRVVEISGMSAHCDFIEQSTYHGQNSNIRPDMVVNLPGNKKLIIDAKAPLSSYLDAVNSKDETSKKTSMIKHADQVKKHILALAKKQYWDGTQELETPEFVILFLPGETFFSAALEQNPALIELALENKVILSTPSTLIALLHSIAYGWRQESLSQNAKQISETGSELYKRLSDFSNYLGKLGYDINSVVNSYNKTIGNLEKRILPSTRKLKKLHGTSVEQESKNPQEVNRIARNIQSAELLENNTN